MTFRPMNYSLNDFTIKLSNAQSLDWVGTKFKVGIAGELFFGLKPHGTTFLDQQLDIIRIRLR